MNSGKSNVVGTTNSLSVIGSPSKGEEAWRQNAMLKRYIVPCFYGQFAVAKRQGTLSLTGCRLFIPTGISVSPYVLLLLRCVLLSFPHLVRDKFPPLSQRVLTPLKERII